MDTTRAARELSKAPSTMTATEKAVSRKVKEIMVWLDSANRAGLMSDSDWAKMVDQVSDESLLGSLAIVRGWAESTLSKAERAAAPTPTNWVKETGKNWSTWHHGKGQAMKAARMAAA